MVMMKIDIVEGLNYQNTRLPAVSENGNNISDTFIDITNFSINELEIESNQMDIEEEIEEECIK